MAASGALDLASADLLDARVWRALHRTAEQLDRRNLAAARRASLDVALAGYVAVAAIHSAEGVQAAGEAVDRAAAAHLEALFPGSGDAAIASRGAAMAAMEKEWAEAYGDPNSPETRAKIEEACRRLAPPAAPKRRRRTEA